MHVAKFGLGGADWVAKLGSGQGFGEEGVSELGPSPSSCFPLGRFCIPSRGGFGPCSSSYLLFAGEVAALQLR